MTLVEILAQSGLVEQPEPITVQPIVPKAKQQGGKLAIVVDACCDLPESVLKHPDVFVLPISLQIGDWTLLDTRDSFNTLEFFRKHISEKGHIAKSIPLSPRKIKDLLMKVIPAEYDQIIALTISSKRSNIYMNTLSAAQHITETHSIARAKLAIETPYNMRVLDTESLFAGQGVVSVLAIEMLKHGKSADEIIETCSTLREHVHGFAVPKDLYYLRNRATSKGDKSVNWFAYQMGKMLDIKPIVYAHQGETKLHSKVQGFEQGVSKLIDYATEALYTGLLCPYIVVSYAGNTDEIEMLPAFQLLKGHAKQRNAMVLLSQMSMTAGLNVGAGAFSIAFAAQNPNLK